MQLPIDSIKPYGKNAKTHTEEQIEHIMNSIKQFGFNDPIGVCGEENICVEGHGRLLALKKLGETEVPCIRLDHLTDEDRRAYMLAHNQTTLETPFDLDMLNEELGNIFDLDMSDFGFLDDEDSSIEIQDNPYTDKITTPIYEITGEQPQINELVDTSMADELIEGIKQSDASKDIKAFLTKAAYRHYVFNYGNIAEYYAHADPRVQDLMEKSALVIIDSDKAVEYGFMKLHGYVEDAINDE